MNKENLSLLTSSIGKPIRHVVFNNDESSVVFVFDDSFACLRAGREWDGLVIRTIDAPDDIEVSEFDEQRLADAGLGQLVEDYKREKAEREEKRKKASQDHERRECERLKKKFESPS